MLKDELMLLSQLAVTFWSDIQSNDDRSADYQSEHEYRIAEDCKRIKKAWTDLLFSQAKDQVIRRFTRHQQQVVLELADLLYLQIDQSRKAAVQQTPPSLKLLVFLLDCLLDLRNFQIQYFHSYINEGGKLPDAVIPAVRKELADKAEQLSANLLTVELDGNLRTCLLDYLATMISTELSAPITYQAAEYFFTFEETISVAIDYIDSRDLTHSVTEVLFYMNFNHGGFCQWYQEFIVSRKSTLRPQDQLPMLNKQLLYLKSMQVVLNRGCDCKAQPVNIQLAKWLNELIRHETFPPEISDGELRKRLELKLTVAQLALFVRLMYEEGCFAIKNIAAIMKFFSRHFIAKKQERISCTSINRLYYTADQFTAYAVREILLKMVARINKMFFPN